MPLSFREIVVEGLAVGGIEGLSLNIMKQIETSQKQEKHNLCSISQERWSIEQETIKEEKYYTFIQVRQL
jgi:hypothetical protein